ncbi:MAG TPA: tetratricopeptide repeat protein, partial [Polyangiaceae bacterium LLY-WYZ-15_(1-7)]|nr:tetratricopeptide repeat protein [Polyangiaceae bacterium LLY-WYZ-15_(1-7)]
TATLESLYERASGLWRGGAEVSGERGPDVLATWAAEQLVGRYDADEKASEAIELLMDASRLPMAPNDAATWRREAARRAAEAGEATTAIELYRDVLRSNEEDVEAMKALGDLLDAAGRRAELLTLRHQELAKVESPERRVELRLDIARIVTEIERTGGRMEALRANLDEMPGHPASLESLEELLVARRGYEELAEVLEAQAARVEPERAGALWARVAGLAEGPLDDVDRAVEAHRKVVEIDPEKVASLDALARIHRERGEAAAASRWLERRLAVAGEDERADLAMELGKALVDAGRADRAAEVLEKALADAPARQDLRDLLAEQYRALEAWEPLAGVLTASAEHAEDQETVLALVREAADLYRDALKRPAEAIPVLRKGAGLAPDDRAIKLQLAEGLQEAGELDEARALLTEVVDAFGRRRSPERAQVHYQLGVVCRAQGDLDAALEQLERATKMAMAEPRMLQMLGRLATEADQLERAEKAYRALLMTVRRQGPAERLDVASGEVLYELHAIAKRRGDDNAGELLESALEAAAQNDAEALRFQEALTERGDAELALKALERRAKAAENASSKATMHAAMAEVLMALDRPAEALDAQLGALREDPARTELQDGALTMAREVGAEEKVTAVFRELVETHQRDEDAALRASLFVHLGEVAEKAGDLDEATSLYGRAEALSDEPVRAWQALARVGAAREDAPLQKRVLAELVEVEDLTPAERADVLHQYARVLLADPTQLDDAVPVARRAFDAEPRSAELAAALDAATERRPDHDEALRLYEEVARDSGDELVLLRFLVRRAAREDATLQQLREACEKAQALAAAEPEPAPELEEGEEEDPAEAEARAAREARRQEVAAEAAQHVEPLLARAVSVAEASEEGITAARWAMRGMAEARAAAGDTPGALEWMQRVVDTAEHEDERRELQRQLAEVAAGEGGDLEIAGDVYAQLLELDPTDATIWRPLLQVYIRQGNEDRLNDLVIQLIDALLEPSLRNEARLAKAKFLMGMEGREFDAVDLLKAALEEEPDHAEAAELLASLYEKSGYDEDLVELLERQLDVARDHQDLEQISELTLRLGALLEKVRREDAVDVYRRALDWVPKDRAIIEAYLRVLGDEDDPREKVEVRERLLAVETGDAASQLARQLYAEWQALEDADGMLRALDLGYRGNPEDAELRGWLEAAIREREDWERLADFLGLEAARLAESDPETAVAKLREAAALKRDTLGDAAGAVELLRQARRATGSVEVLQELVDTLRAAGDLEVAAEEVGQALEAHEAQDATYVHLVTLRARLNLDRDEVDAALADLEAGYPLAADVVREDLARALARKAETAPDAESERAATMRLVEIRGEVDPAAAREVLAGWVEGHPNDVEALQRLRQVDVSTQNWPGVVATCDKLVRVLEGPEQVEAAMLLADAAEAAEVPAEAKAGLELSFQANPANPQVIERLRGLYEQIGAHRELAQLLAHEASSADAERAFELYRRAGKVLIEDVGDADAALPMLQRAVDAKPDDHRTTVLLADAYIGSGYYAEAGQLLEQAIGQQTRRRSPELSQLQHRMARLAKAAGDRNLEMQWLNAALDSDKNNGHVAAELASLAWELGELDLALNALRAVTLSKSEDGPMSRAEAFLMQAKIAHQKGEGRRALLWARKAKSEDPQLEEAQAFLEQLGDG